MIVDELVFRMSTTGQPNVDRARVSVDALLAAALAATAALVGMGLAEAKIADESIKLARGLGLSVEELTEFRFAAQLGGLAAAEVETGIRSLTRQTEQLRRGSAEAEDFFAAVGIRGADLSRYESVSDLLEAVLEGARDIDDLGQRSAVLQGLFGRSGIRFASLVEGGAEGLRELRLEARRLGLVIDEETAVASEALNDDLARLASRAEALQRGFGRGLIPSLRTITAEAEDYASQNLDVWIARADQAGRAFGVTLEALTSPLGRVVTLLGAAGAARGVAGGARAAGAALAASGPLGGALAGFGGQVTAAVGPLALMVGALAAVGLAADDLRTAYEGGDSLSGRLARALGVEDEFLASLDATAELLTAIRGAGEAAAAGIEAALDAAARALPALRPIIDFVRDELPDLGAFIEAVGQVQRGIAGSVDTVARVARGEVDTSSLADRQAIVSSGFDLGSLVAESLRGGLAGAVVSRAGSRVVNQVVEMQISGAQDPEATARAVAEELDRRTQEAEAQAGGAP